MQDFMVDTQGTIVLMELGFPPEVQQRFQLQAAINHPFPEEASHIPGPDSLIHLHCCPEGRIWGGWGIPQGPTLRQSSPAGLPHCGHSQSSL